MLIELTSLTSGSSCLTTSCTKRSYLIKFEAFGSSEKHDFSIFSNSSLKSFLHAALKMFVPWMVSVQYTLYQSVCELTIIITNNMLQSIAFDYTASHKTM